MHGHNYLYYCTYYDSARSAWKAFIFKDNLTTLPAGGGSGPTINLQEIPMLKNPNPPAILFEYTIHRTYTTYHHIVPIVSPHIVAPSNLNLIIIVKFQVAT